MGDEERELLEKGTVVLRNRQTFPDLKRGELFRLNGEHEVHIGEVVSAPQKSASGGEQDVDVTVRLLQKSVEKLEVEDEG